MIPDSDTMTIFVSEYEALQRRVAELEILYHDAHELLATCIVNKVQAEERVTELEAALSDEQRRYATLVAENSGLRKIIQDTGIDESYMSAGHVMELEAQRDNLRTAHVAALQDIDDLKAQSEDERKLIARILRENADLIEELEATHDDIKAQRDSLQAAYIAALQDIDDLKVQRDKLAAALRHIATITNRETVEISSFREPVQWIQSIARRTLAELDNEKPGHDRGRER